jgi:hypothetical protein
MAVTLPASRERQLSSNGGDCYHWVIDHRAAIDFLLLAAKSRSDRCIQPDEGPS